MNIKHIKLQLTEAALLAALGTLGGGTAFAASYVQKFDADPYSDLTISYASDTNQTINLPGIWIASYGSSNEQGVGDQSTNGYFAIVQTTPTNTYLQHGMRSSSKLVALDPGSALSGFMFSCDLRIGGGSGTPADGLSISFARLGDTSISGAVEKGTSTGLAVDLLAYDGDSATGVRGLQINYDGVAITNVPLLTRNGLCGDATSVQTGPTTNDPALMAADLVSNLCWQPFIINANGGLLSVSWKGTILVTNLPIGALAAGNFVISGRTGGLWEEEDIDNIAITTTPSAVPVVGPTTGTRKSWSVKIYDSGSATPNTGSITATVDGVPYTPTITQSGSIGGGDGTGVSTVSYASSSYIFYSHTYHTNVIHFTGSSFSGSVDVTNVFLTPYTIISLDVTHGYPVVFTNQTTFSGSGGGHTGVAGDYALDVGKVHSSNNGARCNDTNFLGVLNTGLAGDQFTVSFWLNLRLLNNGGGLSDTWWFSPTDGQNQGRGLNLHMPYYSGNSSGTAPLTPVPCYYDTARPDQSGGRINTGLTTNDADIFWDGTYTNYFVGHWRHIVITKNGGAKSAWLDGYQIAGLTQASGAIPIHTDMTLITIGSALAASGAAPNTVPTANSLSIAGLIDDYAVFTNQLSNADIAALYAGTAPNAVSGASSLIAWWNFNDAPSISVTKSAGKVVVNFTGILQSATNAAGPYNDMLGIPSPYTNNMSTSSIMFFRSRQ